MFTTAGDSFAVAFPDADSAVNAGVGLQREMMATTFDEIGELRVRVGLHTGTAELRDGDYFGPDVNLAARIMSSAHGGQILASLPTILLAGGVATLDLGQHHLKGVRDACLIHQVVVDGLPNEFPPLRTSSAPLTNLPEARTEVVGREREAQRVVKALEEHRLVSLIGPGGVGKTTLATAVARSVTAADGTWFVDLAPVASQAHIATAFADAVGVTESGSRPLGEQVINHLRDLETVLVVDNCEHIIDGAAGFVDELLSRVPGVRVLATSREVLDLPDEAIVTLGPLEVPGVEASELRAACFGGVATVRGSGRCVRCEYRCGCLGTGGLRRDLPVGRRHAAGHRAGGGPPAHDVGRRARRSSAGAVLGLVGWSRSP